MAGRSVRARRLETTSWEGGFGLEAGNQGSAGVQSNVEAERGAEIDLDEVRFPTGAADRQVRQEIEAGVVQFGADRVEASGTEGDGVDGGAEGARIGDIAAQEDRRALFGGELEERFAIRSVADQDRVVLHGAEHLAEVLVAGEAGSGAGADERGRAIVADGDGAEVGAERDGADQPGGLLIPSADGEAVHTRTLWSSPEWRRRGNLAARG